MNEQESMFKHLLMSDDEEAKWRVTHIMNELRTAESALKNAADVFARLSESEPELARWVSGHVRRSAFEIQQASVRLLRDGSLAKYAPRTKVVA